MAAFSLRGLFGTRGEKRPPRAGGREPLPAGAGAPGESRRPRALAELCSEVFSLVITLRSAREVGEPQEVRARIIRLLDRLDQDARQAGYSTAMAEGARFALIALLDEAILSSQWRGRSAWLAMPLQLELLKINVAGEEFFARLEKLRQNLDENGPLVEVFYDCLALGFEGRYKLIGREKLEALIADLSRELARGEKWNVEDLSPSWKRPDDFTEVVGDGLPVWGTLLFLVPGILVLIVLFGAVGRASAGRTAAAIAQLLAGVGR
jgi:type VI secretion system protein ImpK